ncbi:hypothetical protein LWI29_025364 [Acer saccharum]|uniref:Uncharacterized protein n=1 Tax=Acer saccharum TaxID=4024 RepID=A0AA39RN37_ACESA|nr:hypothetical protein LWI29_025364 [Acer saccharum]
MKASGPLRKHYSRDLRGPPSQTNHSSISISTAGTSGQVTKPTTVLTDMHVREKTETETEKVLIEDIAMTKAPKFVASMNSLNSTSINDSSFAINAINAINKETTTAINEGKQVVDAGNCSLLMVNNTDGTESGISPSNEKTNEIKGIDEVVTQEEKNIQPVMSKGPIDFRRPTSADSFLLQPNSICTNKVGRSDHPDPQSNPLKFNNRNIAGNRSGKDNLEVEEPNQKVRKVIVNSESTNHGVAVKHYSEENIDLESSHVEGNDVVSVGNFEEAVGFEPNTVGMVTQNGVLAKVEAKNVSASRSLPARSTQ